jgi:type VI secretion system secreted protein VgrG
MAAKLAQASRVGSFLSALGEDKLVISRFEGSEELSELFEYRLDVLSEDKNIDFDKILGTNCALSIESRHAGTKRFFNGVLVEAQWVGVERHLSSYRLLLYPWLWLLTRRTNCKIFARKTVPEIIEDVFSKYGFAKYESRLTGGNYPVLEYCVQYRESDFSFVSRLMEEYGIYYFFDHSQSEHKLILADAASAHKPKLAGAKLEYFRTDLRMPRKEDNLHEWVVGRRFRSGKVSMKDYDYQKPTRDLLAEKEANAKYANSKLELYDYPGRYVEKSDGLSLANVRLESEQAQDRRALASGDAVTVCPGHLIQLASHPESSLNNQYLTVRARHTFRSSSYLSTETGEGESYYGQYEFQPLDIPFRSPAKTPKPVIHGPQTAVVVGSGEIDVDEQGRIIVLFHWDRDRNEGDARRVRIGHGWSGAKWGDIKIPRVGMEVIVEFLEGDPDQPLVTGTVYNDDNRTPYDLPSEKTIAGTKSKTDGGRGYNELIFDDLQGDELIRMHAERDMEAKIENDERRDIGNNVTVKIGNNRTEKIGAVWSVNANQKIEFTVGGSQIIMDPVSITIRSTMINIEATANLTEQAGAMAQVTAGAVLALQGALVKIN